MIFSKNTFTFTAISLFQRHISRPEFFSVRQQGNFSFFSPKEKKTWKISFSPVFSSAGIFDIVEPLTRDLESVLGPTSIIAFSSRVWPRDLETCPYLFRSEKLHALRFHFFPVRRTYFFYTLWLPIEEIHHDHVDKASIEEVNQRYLARINPKMFYNYA